MKMIMIADKPIWCAHIMNGDKTIEVRKNKALYKATKKLIEEQGYATFFMYCTKGKPNLWLPYEYDCFELDEASQPYLSDKPIVDIDTKMNGKVVAKFTVRKVEEIDVIYSHNAGNVYCLNKEGNKYGMQEFILKESCLTYQELYYYLKDNKGYAYHIEDLVIFDEPKELWEFNSFNGIVPCNKCHFQGISNCEGNHCNSLYKAPQNFCYVESEE